MCSQLKKLVVIRYGLYISFSKVRKNSGNYNSAKIYIAWKEEMIYIYAFLKTTR
jgi:hypothetical protein